MDLLAVGCGLVIASEHSGNLVIQFLYLFRITLRPVVVGVCCPKQRFCFSDLACSKAFQGLFGIGLSLGVFALDEFGQIPLPVQGLSCCGDGIDQVDDPVFFRLSFATRSRRNSANIDETLSPSCS